MSNVNTIVDAIIKEGQTTNYTVALATAGHVQFTNAGGGVISIAIPNPQYPSNTNVPYPGESIDSIPFVIRAAGIVTLGRGVQWQIDINQGSSISPAIATTGAQTSPTGAGLYSSNFFIEAECLWDSTSQKLRGIYYGFAGENQVAQAPIVPEAPSALSSLVFNVGVTFVNANPGNQATLTTFCIDRL